MQPAPDWQAECFYMAEVRQYRMPSAAIRVCTLKSTIPINAGQELVLGPSEKLLRSVLQTDGVARRRLVKLPATGTESVVLSEVSFVSAINNSHVLKTLLQSKNMQDKLIAGKIMKMAVVLSVVTAKHGSYTTSQPQ